MDETAVPWPTSVQFALDTASLVLLSKSYRVHFLVVLQTYKIHDEVYSSK